tara:strand:- start:3595 stop:4110 length:516 start_codon:yes stop_codon:yes gene_type:complete
MSKTIFSRKMVKTRGEPKARFIAVAVATSDDDAKIAALVAGFNKHNTVAGLDYVAGGGRLPEFDNVDEYEKRVVSLEVKAQTAAIAKRIDKIPPEMLKTLEGYGLDVKKMKADQKPRLEQLGQPDPTEPKDGDGEGDGAADGEDSDDVTDAVAAAVGDGEQTEANTATAKA